MKQTLFTLLFSMSFVFSAPGIAETLTVAVAPNVKYAFDDLQAEFKKETGIDITPVFSSSGKITAQVRHGAPFDVFMSADMGFPETLYKDRYTAGPPRIYAYGALVLWTMKDLDMGKGVELLKDSMVEKVAIANPKIAPYGKEAIKVLKYYKLHDAVESKLVYGEDVSQTSLYIASRAADIGLTAKSVVVSPEMKGKGKWIEIKKESYDPIAQGAVILKHGRQTNAIAAQRFHDFLFSPKARAIFERYGYGLP
ncbi:MAG: molybdate ABC transporter substrate-binding protein [Gammaproteobacteria bacterium]